MSRTDALFTALNRGQILEALEICFKDANGDLDEWRFCCLLAGRLGVSPDDERLKEQIREWLRTCPVVLQKPDG